MRFKDVYLSLGSNLGDRPANLHRALAAIDQNGRSIVRQSPVFETEPQDIAGQPWFLNMAVEIETNYFPRQLLKSLQEIERDIGRLRGGQLKRGPRLIDIDILLFGATQMTTAELTIPHPRMWDRRFVLQPLSDIAPGLRVPGQQTTLGQRLTQLPGQEVRPARL
jgi:2-amino-4-hydroxy-6-hydroxymethyldihydropteridine diphosphokinase